MVIFDINFTKQEASSLLEVLVYANLASVDDLIFTAYLSVDGITRQNCTVRMIFDLNNSQATMPVTIPMFQSGLPAGVHRITFSIINNEPDGPLTLQQGAVIKITELKSASL